MPRSKKAASRGKARGGSRGGGRGGSSVGGRETSFIPFAGTSNPNTNHTGYSLQDEARNTERHHVLGDPQQKLRYSKVKFVSASDPEPSDPQKAESALAGLSLESPARETLQIQVEIDEESGSEEEEEPIHGSLPTESEENSAADLFVVDTIGGETVHTGMAPPRARHNSLTPSNSSEEVILFAGRDSSRRGITRNTKTTRPLAASIDAKIKIVEDQIHQRKELLEETLYHTHPKSSSTMTPKSGGPSSEFEAILPQRSGRKGRRGRRNHDIGDDAIDEALIADYIANIDKDDEDFTPSAFNQREIGATDSEVWQDESDASSEDGPFSKNQLDGWGRSDICDFDDMSTSDGVVGSVQAILSKRERKSGIQYLVVWEGQTVDEARWVPQPSVVAAGATSHIDTFEAEEKFVAEFMDDNDEDSEDSEDSEMDMDEDERDNADLMQRKIDRMTDEQIARLLAKQEELGMGSDELLLFDDDAEEDEDEDMYFSRSKFGQRTDAKPKQRTKGKGAKRPRGDFPAATALADAYDGFDVMDFERPSLKKKPKGRKGRLILDDVSDSELEESMQMAWENDRIKKKERKQEREELRSQGLLGKKNGKPDMKEKYKEGMGILAVKEEIKSFLMGNNDSLSLPPMDKADRKIIHEIANAFKLKSKSVGNGNKRFPILIRTFKTSIYVERTFAEVEARLARRFMPRMDVRRSGGASKRGGRGGGFNSAAVSYRDGDIVGGSAPELGVENRGRAMLEKMGWSSGTALGALNNKGILQPVSHVVKTSKAGLG